MNIFRLCGDMLHLGSIFLLIFKLHRTKNCTGVSCRMQEIYAIVFLLRYMDLLWSFISFYNTCMKLIFMTTTIYLVHLMHARSPYKTTYDRGVDSFRYELYLLGPCLLLGVLFCEEYYFTDICWSTSIWLESVAIIPQLTLLQQAREVENITSDFVGCMGAYRAFYILNWIYRYFAEDYVNWIGWAGGVVQTGLYCDFFYYYAMSKWYGKRLVLPTPT
eukprot:gnl/TRDRNA2_/TRDRNA2_145553_c0_seq2.p1 gnl/TRDRNA2_/TRDRNA2_145553_c0~~gnl/TRDRNA2_/TRDRNA2_145553_c0_seq2.p1  ORF type:complete len:218 (+),score=26.84 gnl/TRDRNA2_/TRDRNA2_145553_c0_seq2:69-722(+)